MFKIEEEKPFDGLEKYQNEFFNSRVEEVQALEKMDSSVKYDEAKKLFHKWKGYSRPYGFFYLEFLSKEGELAYDKQDKEKMDEIIQLVKKYLDEKRKILNL